MREGEESLFNESEAHVFLFQGKGQFIPNLSEIVKELTIYAHDIKKTQDNTSVIIVYFEFQKKKNEN